MKRQPRLCALGVFVLTLVAFLPVLRNGFVDWDDQVCLIENHRFRGLGWENIRWMFTSLQFGNYMPLSWISFAVDYSLWGMDPRGFHLTSLLLHAANAVVFFFISLELFRAANLAPRKQAPDSEFRMLIGSGLSSLLFSLHPLRVESVAWAMERRDVLSGFFYLLTVWIYLKSATAEEAKRRRLRWISWLFYGLSLLSKGIGVTLPLALLILDVYPLRRLPPNPLQWIGRPWRGVCFEKVPYVILALMATAVGVMAQLHVGAVSSVEMVSLPQRMAQASYGLCFYLLKTVSPLGLSPMVERPAPFPPWSWPFWGCHAAILAACALLLWLWIPALLAAGAFYGITLGPVSGLVPLGAQLVADRYSYLCCLGWAALAGGALLSLGSGGPRGPSRWFGPAVLLASSALAILAAMTWGQARVWKDSETLWGHALRVNPRSYVAHNHFGSSQFNAGRRDKASFHFLEALRINPGYVAAHNNLGQLRLSQILWQEAAAHYERSLELNPRQAQAYYNLGLALFRQGRLGEAIGNYRRALSIRPEDEAARNNLGAALDAQGKLEEAVVEFRQVLRINPRNAGAHNNLGVGLARLGRLEEAIKEFQQAVESDPGLTSAQENLSKFSREGFSAKLREREARPR